MLGTGTGSELRHPLGVTIVGGLIVSQVLTLFTTPVIYLAFDRLGRRVRGRSAGTARCRAGRPTPVNLSAPFIDRPVATTLLTIGVALAGVVAFFQLPVSPLPQVDFPTISVSASMPGASPETMATSVATPLERHLGVIADVTEMTSSSSVGSQPRHAAIRPDRNIDGAARDVQAAINAARVDLPAALRSNPTYRKVNPADAPIMILALTSRHARRRGRSTTPPRPILQQSCRRSSGVGAGARSAAARCRRCGSSSTRARSSSTASASRTCAPRSPRPTPTAQGRDRDGAARFQIYTNDQAQPRRPTTGRWSSPTATARRCGWRDVGRRRGLRSENMRNLGLVNGKPAVLVILYRQPGANIIDTVDRVKALLPQLQASIPSDIDLDGRDRPHHHDPRLAARRRAHAGDRHRAGDPGGLPVPAQRARHPDPGVAVPVSLIGTFGAMYLLGYSLDNLSLMALTIATGFVVDDAIVVLENITRHIEAGMPRIEAALLGAREVGFTVLSMSLSLVAVFMPILLMGGIVGRLFREFAVTLSVAILISLVISLTTTPMMCSRFIRTVRRADAAGGCTARASGPSNAMLQRLRAHAALGAAPRRTGDGAAARDRRSQRLSVLASFRRASSRSRTPAG